MKKYLIQCPMCDKFKDYLTGKFFTVNQEFKEVTRGITIRLQECPDCFEANTTSKERELLLAFNG